MERKREATLFNRQSFPSNVFFSKKAFSLFLSNIANNKILIIHGSTFNLAGIDLMVDKNLIGNQLEYIKINETDIFEELKRIKKQNFIPDIIISVGGGTTIDIAKFFLAGFQASKEMDFIELDSFLLWVKENSEFKNQISHYAIVTKPGSGAESSKAMIINNQQNKFVLAKDYFLPNSIFYYENVFKFLPDNEKLFGLTDSLAHAWESYGSPIKNNFVNYLSKSIINNICHDLSNNKVPAQNYAQSSFFGGMLQSDAGSGLTHAFAHSIEYKCSHKHPKLIFFSLPFAIIYWNLYSKNNSLDSSFIEYANKIQKVHGEIVSNLNQNEADDFSGIQMKLKSYNDNEKIIDDLLQDPCARLTPRKLDKDLLLVALNIFIKEKWN